VRAVWLDNHGGPEVLRISQRPEPLPGPSDALIEVKGCGINHLDIWVRKGGPRGFPLPLVLGSDAAGVVREAPPGSRLKPGDEVVIFPAEGCGRCPACERGDEQLCTEFKIYGAARDGGLAELMALPARNCLPKPRGLSFVEAAAVPINYVTAWHMLTARAGLRPGETVLIQAAGSGVSTAAIQIARFLGGRVIATSSTPEKLEHARGQGADFALNYKSEDVPARVRDITGGQGAQVVLDHVGAATWEADIQSLAKGGRLVFCGATSGPEAKLNLSALYLKGQSVLGSTMGTRDELRTVLALMERGSFRPVVGRLFPMEKIQEVHRLLESGEQTGKVVVEI
jgi:NADPH:quinone reductase-like Zn-dependent oxidoreductase